MKFLSRLRGAFSRPLSPSGELTKEEYNPPYLWSKGISQYCDFKGSDTYWCEKTESCQTELFFNKHYAGASGVVWVRMSTQSRDGKLCDLDNFVRGALPTIREPFALVTTDGDVSIPSDLPKATVNALLNCPWLVAWYTQNYDGHPHEKFVPFPIGLDLHTPHFSSNPAQIVAELGRIRGDRLPIDQVPLKVFCDLEVSLTSEERHRAVASLRKYDHVYFLRKRLSQINIWRRYAQYPFVVSTVGNGLDCHRTWELLYLGAIVITKTSSLDHLYEGLPVVIVGDWSEVGEKNNLRKWLQQYARLTDREYIYGRLEPGRMIKSIRETLAKS